MGNVQVMGQQKKGLTKFQRKKLKYDFYTFFDLNNDGCLTYQDFLWAKDKICYMSGWKIDSEKYKITEALFKEIWESLSVIADLDKDQKITNTEWLEMWTVYKREIVEKKNKDSNFLKKYYKHVKESHTGEKESKSEISTQRSEDKGSPGRHPVRRVDSFPILLDSDEEFEDNVHQQQNSQEPKEEQKASVLEKFADRQTRAKHDSETDSAFNFDESKLPKWLFKYLVFRFNLLDRTGDNVIDSEEFEYVLSEFGVSERIARQSFTIFTKNGEVPLDFEYFVHLFEEYYLSDDPSSLGNFINGKLDFEDITADSEDEDPGLVDHHQGSSTSLRSMDDDLRDESMNGGKSIKLHEYHSQHAENHKQHESHDQVSCGKKVKAQARRCCATS